MKQKAPYPYILSKKDDTIRLEITGGRYRGILYFPLLFFFTVCLLSFVFMIFIFFELLGIAVLLFSICIISVLSLFIFFLLYILNWKRRGKEIFILHPNKLEWIEENKPFKTYKKVYHFSKIELLYDSGVDYYTEEEALLLGVELDIEKLEGNYPIRFNMDDGDNIIDSERDVPAEVIRRIKRELLLIQIENLGEKVIAEE